MIWFLSIEVLAKCFRILRTFFFIWKRPPQCCCCYICPHCSLHQISEICRLAEMNTTMLSVFNSKCSDFSAMHLCLVCCVHVHGLLKEEASEYFFRRDKTPQRSVAEGKRLMRAHNTLTPDNNNHLVKTIFWNWENLQSQYCFMKSLEYNASWQCCVAIRELWSPY